MMSIAAAVGAGLVISGIVIKFQKDVYDKKISELQGYASELDGHLSTLEGYKSEIKGFWDDDTADNYIRVIDKQIAQIKVVRDRIDGLSKLYDNLKGVLEKSHETVSEKVDEIGGIVDLLTGRVD